MTTNPLFDPIIDRRGTHCSRWDTLERRFGVPLSDGISMWTADSDFKTAPCVLNALAQAHDHGIFGYFDYDYSDYNAAICWWMQTRHNWTVDPDWILTSQGLGHAIAMCFDTFTKPGDGVLIFSPVYHEFRRKIERAGRVVTESPLVRDGQTYVVDFDDAERRLTGNEKVLLWCSPQNPSGRIWTPDELRAVAAFAEKHDLLLISDEVHHDFIFPGNTFVPMETAAPECRHRLVALTAASKTFNIAGMKTGNLIIPDQKLRDALRTRLSALDYAPNVLGIRMVQAAYSPEGAEWVDAQVDYIDGNRRLFDGAMNAIPGVRSMPLQSTYLAWVEFAGTGMTFEEIDKRIRTEAHIVAHPGPEFGAGGETSVRFNLAAPRGRIEQAIERLNTVFADLQ